MKIFAFALAACLISGVIFAEPFGDKSAPIDEGNQLGQDVQDEVEPLGLTGFKEIDENYFEAEPVDDNSSRVPVRIRLRSFNDSSP
jgi:hypothetical protein